MTEMVAGIVLASLFATPVVGLVGLAIVGVIVLALREH